jgi:hypothetical protein
MSNTFQTKGQTIMQHGLDVWKHTEKLLSQNFEGFRIPLWLHLYKEQIFQHLHDVETIKTYNIYHDIGKPFCLQIDENGKQHFPNHAKVSYETWMNISDNKIIGNLILHDMDAHTMKFEEFMAQGLSIPDICTLLITALAELHSNADLFGGIETDSFKIKFKRLEKLGRKICEHKFGNAFQMNEQNQMEVSHVA